MQGSRGSGIQGMGSSGVQGAQGENLAGALELGVGRTPGMGHEMGGTHGETPGVERLVVDLGLDGGLAPISRCLNIDKEGEREITNGFQGGWGKQCSFFFFPCLVCLLLHCLALLIFLFTRTASRD